MQKGNVDAKDAKNDVKWNVCQLEVVATRSSQGKAPGFRGVTGKWGWAASGRAKIRPGFARGKRTTID